VFSSTARLTAWRLAGVFAAVGAIVAASAGTGSAATFGTPYQIGLDPNTPTQAQHQANKLATSIQSPPDWSRAKCRRTTDEY
jgi:hypothetical protein